jgi:hypothetical protein
MIHSISGLLSTGGITFAGIYAIKTAGGVSFGVDLHYTLGFFAFLCSILLGVGGMTVSLLRFVIKPRWATAKMLLTGKFHKYFGYTMMLFT